MPDPAAIVRDPARLDRVVRVLRLSLRTSGAGLALVDDRFTYKLSQDGFPASLATLTRFDMSTTLTGALVASGRVLQLEDAMAAPEERASGVLRAHGLRAYLGAPVRDGAGRALGGLFVVHDVPRRFGDDDIEIVSGLAELVGGELVALAALEGADALRARHDAERSDFAARLAHRLSDPMNAILGACELLSATELDVKQRRLLDMVRAAGDELRGALDGKPPRPPARDAGQPSRDRGSLELLAVDDREEGRALMAGFLDGVHHVELVESGALALERMRARRYDLVLLDLQMPGLGGVEVARRMRADEQARGGGRTPIVAVTAHSSGVEVEAAHRAGCDAHLEKPFSRDDLLRVIARLAGPRLPPTEPAPRRDVVEAPRELHPQVVALVPAFLEARRRDLRELEAACARHDHEAVARIAHVVKGLGGTYGFRAVSELGAALEAAARARDEASVRATVAELDACVHRLSALHAPKI